MADGAVVTPVFEQTARFSSLGTVTLRGVPEYFSAPEKNKVRLTRVEAEPKIFQRNSRTTRLEGYLPPAPPRPITARSCHTCREMLAKVWPRRYGHPLSRIMRSG